MSNNMINSKVLQSIFFLVFFAVSGLASCSSGDNSTTVIAPSATSVSLDVSPSSGVAPLAVFFDATQTTANYIASTQFDGGVTGVINASISGTTLTINSVISGAAGVNSILTDASGSLIAGTTITGSSIGSPPWIVSTSQTVASENMTLYNPTCYPVKCNTNPAFHNLQYTWDFGDTAGTQVTGSGGAYGWNNGAASGVAAACTSTTNTRGCRNYATGAIAAHIYEVPGTYNPKLTVTDGTNTITLCSSGCTYYLAPITISAFSGTTICVDNLAGHTTGCTGTEVTATGAGSFNNAMTAAITACGSNNCQILFNKGDTFDVSATTTVSKAGSGIIGAYGSGVNPIITDALTGSFAPPALVITASDWRVMDLTLNGAGSYQQKGIKSTGSKATLLRVFSNNFLYHTESDASDQMTIQDSTFAGGDSTAASYGLYCGVCSHITYLGNSTNMGGSYQPAPANTSHDVRIQGAGYVVVENNTNIGGNAGGKIYDPFLTHGQARYGEIADNSFTGLNIGVGPQNQFTNEHMMDFIVERNYLAGGAGAGGLFSWNSSYTTLRNNIFDGTLSSGGNPYAIALQWSSASPEPTGNEIYNNTFYNGSTNCCANAVVLNTNGTVNFDSNCTVSVANNLAYWLNTEVSQGFLKVVGGSCTINGTGYVSGANGNTADSGTNGIHTNPNWTNGSGSYSLTTDFKPNTVSYAIGAGVNVPVYQDFFGNTRAGSYDMGAVNH